MTLQLSEKIDVYRMGLGSLKRYMDRFTTDLFEKMSQAVTEAIAVGQAASVAGASNSESSEGSFSSVESYGKFFRHEPSADPQAFDEINRLRGNVNQLEVLHAKLQYMMVELESLAKRSC